MMHLDLMDKRFGTAREMAESDIISAYYVQKNVLKLSDNEISRMRIEQEKEAVAKSILEKLEGGEDPGAPGMGGGDFGGDDDKDDGDDNATEDRENWTKDTMPYDPTGTRELPGYPKDYSYNENGFIKTNGKPAKVDVLDKTIADIMQYNYESKSMLENLATDRDDQKLPKDSTLKSIINDI
jgi:hypothetical protein